MPGPGPSAAAVPTMSADHIRQPPVPDISVSPEPDESLGNRHAQLHRQHAGRLVDLGPVQRRVRGPPVWPAPPPSPPDPPRPPPRRAAARRRVRQDQQRHRVAPVSGPGEPRYRPNTPAPIAPSVRGNANTAPAPSGPPRRVRGPPAAGPRIAQVSRQHRRRRWPALRGTAPRPG